MIHDQNSYVRRDRIRDIITDNNQLLMVLSRFDISLGFGDNTVEQVCRDNGVDTDTFLAVINFISGKKWEVFTISLPSLIKYLRKSHVHFIDYALPSIKKKLIEGIYESEVSEMAMLILKYYDDYEEEIRKHMGYEDEVVFRYVEHLIDGKAEDRIHISDFSKRHEHMAGKLDDLKELFVYQFNQRNSELINSALLNMMMCGNELVAHYEIENKMLFPNVERLEREVIDSRKDDKEVSESAPPIAETLSDREREIISCVAHGLSNKEIADKLCLSFHTITTYRRNISEKLNIHSTAALVIFAIVNKIVDIHDIPLTSVQ